MNVVTVINSAAPLPVKYGAVSAALGWTIPATPAGGTTPTIATWTKPANVPYLNLFCDPTAYQCNSPTTLNYLSGIAETNEWFHVRERGIKADGPLFDLPGGTVKMAIGANLTTYDFIITQTQTNPTNPTVTITQDPQGREVWATFAQLNIPIFSEQNAIPLIRRFEFEAAGAVQHGVAVDRGERRDVIGAAGANQQLGRVG